MDKIQIEAEKKSQILEALARYKYLTVSQFLHLGLGGKKANKSYLNGVLKKMRSRSKARIDCIPFSGVYKFQNREYVYYLTNRGEEDLILQMQWDSEDIRRPIGTSSMYDKDYMHRKYFIDIQISLYRWAEQVGVRVPVFDTYFDFTGSSRERTLRAKTSILLDAYTRRRVVPDGLFFLEKNEVLKLFALEMHMHNDTGRAMEQIRNHKKTLDIGSASEHYGFSKGNRVLYVFEKPSIMKTTIKAFRNSSVITEAYYPYFLFGTYEQLKSDFTQWVDCNGEIKSLV